MSRPIRSTMSNRNLSLMGVPKKFHGYTIDDFKDYKKEDIRKVKNFINDYLTEMDTSFEENKGLFLYGSNGVGKTLISCLIVKEAYRRRYTARRVTFVEYISLYTQMWGAKTPEAKEMAEDTFYNSAKAREFLVIEEVGKEIDSKIASPILEDCLRYREDNGLVTIICTNLDLSEMSERYGASCLSLMKGNMTPVLIEGKDKRKEFYDNK